MYARLATPICVLSRDNFYLFEIRNKYNATIRHSPLETPGIA